MNRAFAFALFRQSSRKGDCQRVGVLQSDGAFDAFHICRQVDVVIRSFEDILDLPECFDIVTAERDRRIVMIRELVACARTAYRVDAQVLFIFRQTALPVVDVGDHAAVFLIDHPLRDGDKRNIFVEDRQDIVREPVDAEA